MSEPEHPVTFESEIKGTTFGGAFGSGGNQGGGGGRSYVGDGGIHGEDNMAGLHRIEWRIEALFVLYERFANATVNELRGINNRITELERIVTSGQNEIDADVASLTASEASIASAVQELQAEIANLQSQGVDTTALDAIAAKLASDASTDTPATPAPVTDAPVS